MFDSLCGCDRYVSPEQVPIHYGGLSTDYCDCDSEFTVDDPATVLNLKTATKQFVEIICSEVGYGLVSLDQIFVLI